MICCVRRDCSFFRTFLCCSLNSSWIPIVVVVWSKLLQALSSNPLVVSRGSLEAFLHIFKVSMGSAIRFARIWCCYRYSRVDAFGARSLYSHGDLLPLLPVLLFSFFNVVSSDMPSSMMIGLIAIILMDFHCFLSLLSSSFDNGQRV